MMAAEAGQDASKPGGKRILGMKPMTAYLVFGGALLVGIVAYLIREHQAAAQQAATGATSGSGSGTAGDIDYSGELSAIQAELEALQQAGTGGATGTSGGGSSGGGAWWNGGGDTGGSGDNSGTGTGTGGGTSGATTGGGGTASSGSSGSSGGTTSSGSSGSTSSGGAPKTAPGNVSASPSSLCLKVTWSAVSGATSYEVDVFKLDSGNIWDGHVTGTSASIGEVGKAAAQGYVKVRAVNASGAGPWSATKEWSFKK